MKNKILLVSLLIFIIFAAAILNQFFANDDPKRNVNIEGVKFQENKKNFKTIGIVVNDMQHAFMADLAGILREKAKEFENIKILLYDSEGRNDKQILQLEELIDLKVDGIILAPTDRELVDKGIEKAYKANIPVITVNVNVSSSLADCYIGSDPVQAGKFQGEYVADKLKGKGNIVVITGQKGRDATDNMLAGLKSAICKYPSVHITRIDCNDWKMKKGKEIIKDILNRHKKIDAFVFQDDELLLEALPVFETLELRPVIIGAGAAPEAIEAIKEARLDATVYQSSKSLGIKTFETMMKIFKGEHVDKVKLIPYELVTPENIDNYIKQNFSIR